MKSHQKKLKDIFQQNGYSGNLFMNTVKSFVNQKTNLEPQNESQNDTVDAEKSYLLMIPYVGKPSLIFKRNMTEIVKDAFDVKLRCAYTSYKVKNYFSLKCPSMMSARPFTSFILDCHSAYSIEPCLGIFLSK